MQNTPTSGGNNLPARETPFREKKIQLFLGRSSSGGFMQGRPLSGTILLLLHGQLRMADRMSCRLVLLVAAFAHLRYTFTLCVCAHAQSR